MQLQFTLPTSDDRLITVPQSQVDFQKLWESASLFIQAPFMVWLSTRRELPRWARIGSLIGAGLIVYVDGGLLLRWRKLRA